MSSQPSVPAPGVRDNVDTGSLSWVIAEIREALNRSASVMTDAVTQDEDARATTLRHARAYLHQAHGALQIVDVDGVTIVTETVEDLLDRMGSGQVALTAGAVQLVDNAYQALLAYLDELLAGAPQQPVRLFPYYRALLELRGAERIHPADLFFPNLAARPPLPSSDTSPAAATIDYVQLRKRFEMALLPFLKKADGPAGAASAASITAMQVIIDQIEQAQATPQSRNFWWVLRGFAEGVASGQIPAEVYVKQVFARINLQIRRLGEGSASIAERLLRDALFFIARIEAPSPLAQQICAAYGLDGLVPTDYARPRYAQVDIDALAQARERLGHAKNLWNRIAGGDASVADAFDAEMRRLAETGDSLGSPPLAKFLRELNGIARHAAHARPGDQLGLEMATCLLFVENALHHPGQREGDFSGRADALTARLLSMVAGETPPEAGEWLDDMSRQAQQRQTVTALAAEMHANLRQVEKSLEDYFRDPQQRAGLPQVGPVLHQISGALSVLDQDDAMRAVQHIEKAVQAFIDTDTAAPDVSAHAAVAQNIGALSFFIETLQLHPDAVKGRFSFDDAAGVFRANLTEKKLTPEHGPAHEAVSTASTTEAGAATAAAAAAHPDHAIAQANFTAAIADISLDFPELPVVATVEDEMRQHQQQSADLAAALLEHPHDPALRQQLRDTLHQVQRDARLLDNHDAGEQASTAIARLAQPDFVASRASLSDLLPAPADAPAAAAPAVPQSEDAIDAELLEIFLGEADEVLASVRSTLPQSRQHPQDSHHLSALRRAFHTLKGSGRMVGLEAFGAAAWAIEQVLNACVSQAQDGSEAMYVLLARAETELTAWVDELKTTGHSPRSAQALVAAAQRLLDGTPEDDGVPELTVSVSEDALPETSQDEPADALPEPPVAAPVVASAEVIAFPGMGVPAAARDDTMRRIGHLDISVPLHGIYLAETDDLVRILSHDLAEWRHEPQRPVATHAVHAAHSLAGSSATVGFKALQELAHALEKILQLLARKQVALGVADFDTLEHSLALMKAMLQEFALGDLPLHQPAEVNVLGALLRDLDARTDLVDWSDTDEADPVQVADADAVMTLPADGAAGHAVPVTDELDVDLLPVFMEEGRDLLPQMGAALRAWQQELASTALPQSVLRLLHTTKGSARMAGAMRLGQYLHDTESQIEHVLHAGRPGDAALEALLARHDHALYLFELLQNPLAALAAPVPQAPADAAVLAPVLPLRTAGFVPPDTQTTVTATAQPAQPAPAVPATPAPLVRVRADILDRLVNQAGEVSISRSRLETDVETLRQSLGELTDNVARLRDQLREIEMQAETQITSRMAHAPDREFDPLEFDRFTRLQEITRMMAESVSDVASVQQNLTRTVDQASVDLVTQARLTRELQQDLMRVRMVPFSSIAERLYRVSRQTSKEVDKRVNLDIRGGTVEVDRSVLEKMAGPFEHLLRNAIVHGIEGRDERVGAGKAETGELRVEIRQDGNEVVLQFSDDGRGLDLERIRSKAAATGLLPADRELAESELTDLIFNPGFSTAQEVTELAGRGVGMDVVRAEVSSLGGRIAIASEAGKGAQFTIHLPLTLAVTQVVILRTGDKVYAVPSVLVEQVQQLKASALASAYNDGAVQWQGQRVPLFYLPALLGDRQTVPVTQQYSPLIILRSGSERVAIHVDDIQGNREVVVKNIGPQLARMIGIAGATVLGSGEIVLILNPVPLAQRALLELARAPSVATDAGSVGAIADTGNAVQGLRAQPVVMVVDDSLTVRRVTQRLLAREGYQVVLAKDGIDALEQLQTITPDVMLVDIEMPRMDGFDLTRNVRGDARTGSIPIIMITSRTAAKHRNYAMELGVNEYLGKPYQEADLLAAISGFLQSA